MISQKLRTAHLTLESIIEEADSGLRKEAQGYQSSGQSIPTDLWMKLIRHRLSLYDAVKKGWVMDGIPETREQALELQVQGIYPKHCG